MTTSGAQRNRRKKLYTYVDNSNLKVIRKEFPQNICCLEACKAFAHFQAGINQVSPGERDLE